MSQNMSISREIKLLELRECATRLLGAAWNDGPFSRVRQMQIRHELQALAREEARILAKLYLPKKGLVR